MAGIPPATALRDIQNLFAEGSLSGLSDSQLLERFLDRRDEGAFAALVERHGRPVLSACRAAARDPADAEDAFQATFLLLARKAGAIRDRAALGAWLHRVARRAAVQARADAARRRRRERQAAALRGAGRAGGDPGHERFAMLHEEIDRLPDRHRLPLILCHLEELPHDQAARRLRWSERTLRRRLAEARERLRSRLDRRGVALPGGLLAAALAREASAAVPTAWAAAAARSATAATAAPAAVAALAQAILRGMLLARIKLTALAALAAAMLALVAVGVIARDEPEGVADAPKRAAVGDAGDRAPAHATAPTDPGDRLAYAGRVLDPLGRPVAGATLSLEYDPSRDKGPGGPVVRATSDADGRFRFTVPKSLFDPVYEDEPWKGDGVVARAEGYGLGIGPASGGDEPWTLRLAEDLPIAGRILDLQGRPLAGIVVRPFALQATARGDLDPILRAYTDRGDAVAHPATDRIYADIPDLVPPAVTGADGRFRLAGLGRERLVGAMIEGPGIETAYALIMTRRAATIHVAPPGDHPRTIYGAEFEHIAGPSQPIIGVVRDADTGAPLEGAKIEGNFPAGFDHVKAVTDRAGRYHLDGLPAGRQAHLSVLAPRGEPYLRAARFVRNDLAGGPTEVSFALKRGLWIRGRVTDRATGRPVRAQVDYFVFPDNPHLREAPHFSDDSRTELRWTAPDGSYRVAGLPGRGMIAVKAHAREDYCVGVGAGEIRGDDPEGLFPTRPGFCNAVNYNVLAEVSPPEDLAEATCDLAVDPGRSVKVAVLDPDGVPLAGAVVLNRKKPWFDWPLVPLESPEFEIVRLAAGEVRTLTILHDGRKLAAALVVRGEAPAPGPGPVTVRLQPWGVVTGRLVDEWGEPRSGVNLQGMDRPRYDPVDGGVGPAVPVGDDGRFRIEGLVPGRRYTFRAVRRRHGIGTIAADLAVAPGETKDLGDVSPVEAP